jgi:CheY-like chemotaxis protein/anti-sigma regulatory factor (Ser/Thr protein kinase)
VPGGVRVRGAPEGIALIVDHPDDAIGHVVGDEIRLRQLLFNLVGNAVKFTERGRVTVSVRVESGLVALAVADTGIGIPRDRQAAVFERFVQAESGTTRRFGGSGLGLALCREMVRAMGGEIRVESEPGVGSVFRVALPWRVQVRPQPATLADRRILCWVADPVESSALAARLRARGADVKDAMSGAEFARLLASDLRFDAAIVDARQAEGDGLDLLERSAPAARAAMRRVVLLPMNHRVGDLTRCEAIDAAALCKPVRWTALERALREGRADQPEHAPNAVAPSFAGRRVLLVDDAPENRLLAQAHLRATGCRVELALDGAQAFEQWRRGDFDLVLMDVHMPVVDGCEATRRIREEERRSGRRPVPIVALSADTEIAQREASLAAGCDGHLGKPFTQQELFAMVRRFVPEADAAADAESAAEVAANSTPAQIPADVADLAEEYLTNRRADAAALRAAARSGDLAGARRRGHNMKGSGAGYGFPRVSELGARIERAAESGDIAALERWADVLSDYAERQLGEIGGQLAASRPDATIR